MFYSSLKGAYTVDEACKLCGGACCRSFTIPVAALNGDAGDWLKYHGTQEGVAVRFNCACSKLKEGKCSIYESRPKVCKDYQVGSLSCRKAIKMFVPHKEKAILSIITSAQKPSPMQE